MLILKLTGLIEESARGSVSRDLLLQRVSLLLDCPQAVTWGPACNRAVREEHPHSVAQRKGKFKKYPSGTSAQVLSLLFVNNIEIC